MSTGHETAYYLRMVGRFYSVIGVFKNIDIEYQPEQVRPADRNERLLWHYNECLAQPYH